ncbi:type II toxin-antitoxin system Phd/YefM family antitoxin [Nocardia sp. CWNU-33]|uniref:type II toxin-antitoxin system Phd/YefM family antitoxin n=1 Tax=Nocardia sp. CWNU-33 TaxID=3392117 RepID=UPI00398F2440
MSALPISKVRQNLFGLVQQVNDDHDPLTVVTKSGENAVLVAESDWNSLMETLYVLQTHGGVELLKSAQDARDGRTQTHALIDPDEETENVATAEMTGVPYPSAAKVRALVERLRASRDAEIRQKLLDELLELDDLAGRPTVGVAWPSVPMHARPPGERSA